MGGVTDDGLGPGNASVINLAQMVRMGMEIDEKTALIADLEVALKQANDTIIRLTEESGPWKARAMRAEKLIEDGLNMERLAHWLASKGCTVIGPDGKGVV